MSEIAHRPDSSRERREPEAVAMPIAALGWHPVRSDKPTPLKGHVDLHIPRWRLRLYGCPVFKSIEAEWVGLPSKPVSKEGDKVKYAAMAEFDDRATQSAFSKAALAALDQYFSDWREGGR